jgi:hypothetical protein
LCCVTRPTWMEEQAHSSGLARPRRRRAAVATAAARVPAPGRARAITRRRRSARAGGAPVGRDPGAPRHLAPHPDRTRRGTSGPWRLARASSVWHPTAGGGRATQHRRERGGPLEGWASLPLAAWLKLARQTSRPRNSCRRRRPASPRLAPPLPLPRLALPLLALVCPATHGLQLVCSTLLFAFAGHVQTGDDETRQRSPNADCISVQQPPRQTSASGPSSAAETLASWAGPRASSANL